jgi:hypothetical protein
VYLFVSWKYSVVICTNIRRVSLSTGGEDLVGGVVGDVFVGGGGK